VQKYQDAILRSDGRPAAGATVTVTTAAGAAATLYSADGSGAYASNVVTADASGEYSFYAANGRYNLAIAFGTASETKSDVLLFDPADTGAVAAVDTSVADAGSYYTGTDVEEALQEVGAKLKEVIAVACSDETTALTSGAAKATFRMPFAMTVQAVRASLSTAQTSGNIITVDINDGVSSILGTLITIDNGEKTSTTADAPAVISDTALADDAEISVDLDQIGDGTAKGLKVYILGVRA
jgi:hypothetical protein